MKKLFVLFVFVLIGTFTMAQSPKNSPIGLWLNESGEARIEIYQCQDQKLCGKIVWLKEPLRDGKPKTDLNNPKENLRNKPILGMVMMQSFEHAEGNEWEDGTIYDP